MKKEKGKEAMAAVLVKDERFARLHFDPRFQRLPKNKSKVSIDSRFQHMFTDKAFKEPVDKRGKARQGKPENTLRRYYKLDDEEHGDSGDEPIPSEDEDHVVVGKGSLENEKAKAKRKVEKKAAPVDVQRKRESDQLHREAEKRQVLHREWPRELPHTSSEEEAGVDPEENDSESDITKSSSSSSDSDSEIDEVSEQDEEEKAPTTEQETRRLAVVNLDWIHVRAVDLFVLLRSFLPKGGCLASVTVYPSEFGIKQMAEEEIHGPKSLYSDTNLDDDDDEDEADPEKLREYEKAKLRYYYAVVECDSSATAACLYSSCDGAEFERTSNTLDLRYIPDDMKFIRLPRDVATEVPADYKPPAFETKALQHSNVKLTWDDDEPLRSKALRRKFNAAELNELDFRAYVATSSSESASSMDDDCTVQGEQGFEKEKVRSKYLSLLGEHGPGEEEDDSKASDEGDQGNMEIKFHTGLEELSEKLLLRAKKNNDETVWEAYLRKKKEKKKARKKSSNGKLSEDEVVDDRDEVDPFDDPFFLSDGGPVPGKNSVKPKAEKKKSTKASREEDKTRDREESRKQKEDAEKSTKELELLLMDDHTIQHGVKAETSRKEESGIKSRKKKGKGKGQDPKQMVPTANYEDPRFSSLFTSHHFAIDPTNPQYKKTGAYLGTIAERQRRHLQSLNPKGNVEDGVNLENGLPGSNDRKRKAELTSLVKSLKAKVKTSNKVR